MPGHSDFSNQKEAFFTAIEYFGAAEEDIRSAAAFAAGNIAIGNLHCFLPHLVKLVQTDKEKRLLALHSLKEVSLHILIDASSELNTSRLC
jgi:cullin-associated NEDD8-dissociated protein 1